MFDTRFNSRFVAIGDQLLNASEKRDRLEGFGEVLSFLQDVSTPSRVVPVFTGRWWAFSLHDRFDRYSIDESRLEKEIGGLCQEVAEKLSHFDGKDKQLSLTILLGQTARNTMAAVTARLWVCLQVGHHFGGLRRKIPAGRLANMVRRATSLAIAWSFDVAPRKIPRCAVC